MQFERPGRVVVRAHGDFHLSPGERVRALRELRFLADGYL